MEEIIVSGKQEFLGKQVPIIKGGFGENQKCVLASTIAEIHSVATKEINKLINNNKDEFEDNIDIIDLKTFKIKELVVNSGLLSKAQWGNSNNVYILSEQGYAKLYSLFRYKNEECFRVVMKKIFNSKVLYVQNNIYNKEIRFRERLGKILNQLNIVYEFQYKVLNYRIDIYLPLLNIAIEYDENNHKYYTYKQHNDRQAKIENKLGCKFIRVSDSYDIDTAIGIVLKNIYLSTCRYKECY